MSFRKTMEIPEHLLVKNPHTGKFINVLPLFALMNQEFSTNERGPIEIIRQIQEVHDFVSTRVPNEEMDAKAICGWADISHILVQLRKAFERMAEYNS